MKCWFCGKDSPEIIEWAYAESPTRPVIEAHEGCPKRYGFSEALVPVKK